MPKFGVRPGAMRHARFGFPNRLQVFFVDVNTVGQQRLRFADATQRSAVMLCSAASLAFATQVTPARSASAAPQAAETFKSSAVIFSRRARVSFFKQPKKSASSFSRKPLIAVSSRCECALTK